MCCYRKLLVEIAPSTVATVGELQGVLEVTDEHHQVLNERKIKKILPRAALVCCWLGTQRRLVDLLSDKTKSQAYPKELCFLLLLLMKLDTVVVSDGATHFAVARLVFRSARRRHALGVADEMADAVFVAGTQKAGGVEHLDGGWVEI